MPETAGSGNQIDEELGVNEEYADELRERMGGSRPNPLSLLDQLIEALEGNVPANVGDNSETGRWITLLVGAMMEGVRETERLAVDRSDGNEAVRKQAVSLYQKRMVNRALDGTLFDPLEENHPDTFREILTLRFPQWAVEKAYGQVQELQGNS